MKRFGVGFILALVLLMFSFSAEASSSRPHYSTPSNVVAFPFTTTSGEAVFRTVKYADFYKVSYSTHKSMEHAKTVVTDTPDVNGVDLDNLKPDTKYYVTVKVCSSRGESLSNSSSVVSFRTYS